MQKSLRFLKMSTVGQESIAILFSMIGYCGFPSISAMNLYGSSSSPTAQEGQSFQTLRSVAVPRCSSFFRMTSLASWMVLVKTNELHDLLDDALRTRSTEHVRAVLETLIDAPELPVLTIVANAGVHEIPRTYLRGEVYE